MLNRFFGFINSLMFWWGWDLLIAVIIIAAIFKAATMIVF